MCTAITVQTAGGDVYFGRTMDFSYPLDPELYVIPRGYRQKNLPGTHVIQNRYQVMGIGQDISPVILADGMNEAGFAAAVLYFPGYASYDSDSPDYVTSSGSTSRMPVAALELVNVLLGQCASVEEAASILRLIQITGVKDSVTNSVAPLHWILADKSGNCMTVEKTSDGLHLMDNTIGVLSNSPDFKWHMTNLRNYMNLSPDQLSEAKWDNTSLTPFGQGGGSFGLPGSHTPPSRFVRAAYTKSHTMIPQDQDGAVTACFHILDGVTIPKGVVMTDRGTPDYTQYTAFIQLSSGEYFFRTYDNSQIATVKMPSGTVSSGIVSLGKLNRTVVFETW